jgi:hypothetical protein
VRKFLWEIAKERSFHYAGDVRADLTGALNFVFSSNKMRLFLVNTRNPALQLRPLFLQRCVFQLLLYDVENCR